MKARTPSGHIVRSRDGSRKTSSLIRYEPTTLTKNHQRSREKKTNRKEKFYGNCVGNVTVFYQSDLKEADNLPKKVAI